MTIRSGRCLRGREGPLRVRWPNGMRERRTSRSTSMRESSLRIRRARGWVHSIGTTSGQLKIVNRDYSKTEATPTISEMTIGFYVEN